MPTQHCVCGAKYRFPETAVGKRTKCKRCGTVFTLAGDDELSPIPIADDDVTDETPTAANRADAVTDGASPVSAACLPSSEATGRLGHVVVEKTDKPKTYEQSVFGAFLFVTSLHNAVTFIVLWVVFFVLTLLFTVGVFMVFRFVFYLAFLGWWAAYRFNVVASGAAGDDDLPDLVVPDEGVVALLITFLHWVGSWLVVLIPATVFALIAFMQGWMDPDKFIDALDEGVAGVAGVLFSDSGSGAAAFAGLVVLGMFFWPIIILCIALGGFQCIRHVDLIVTTIVRTFPVYLFTAVMVFGADWLGYVLAGFVETRLSGGEGAGMSGWLGSSIPVAFPVMGITIYSEIVAMKLIGLYYHHFKDRFAWSWG